MDLNQYLLALQGAPQGVHHWCSAVTVVAALVVALVMPKTLRRQATDARRRARRADDRPAARMSPRERAGYMSTQMDLIQSGNAWPAGRAGPEARPEPRRARGVGGGHRRRRHDRRLDRRGPAREAEGGHRREQHPDHGQVLGRATRRYAAAGRQRASPRRTSTWRSSCAPSPRARPAQWFDEQLKALRADVDAARRPSSPPTRSRRASLGADERMRHRVRAPRRALAPRRSPRATRPTTRRRATSRLPS